MPSGAGFMLGLMGDRRPSFAAQVKEMNDWIDALNLEQRPIGHLRRRSPDATRRREPRHASRREPRRASRSASQHRDESAARDLLFSTVHVLFGGPF